MRGAGSIALSFWCIGATDLRSEDGIFCPNVAFRQFQQIAARVIAWVDQRPAVWSVCGGAMWFRRGVCGLSDADRALALTSWAARDAGMFYVAGRAGDCIGILFGWARYW